MKPLLKINKDSNAPLRLLREESCAKRQFLSPQVNLLYDSNGTNNQPKLFIAMSIGASPKDTQLLKQVFEIAGELGIKDIVVMVADTLNKYNEFVFGSRSLNINSKTKTSAAERRAYRLGSSYVEAIDFCQVQLDSSLKIIRWDDVLTENYIGWVDVFKKEYRDNFFFKQTIDSVVLNFAKKRNSQTNITSERHKALVNYVLEELPSLTKGIEYNGSIYNSYIHPFITPLPNRGNPMSDLAIKIITENEFSNLRQRLGGTEMAKMIDLEFVEIHR